MGTALGGSLTFSHLATALVLGMVALMPTICSPSPSILPLLPGHRVGLRSGDSRLSLRLFLLDLLLLLEAERWEDEDPRPAAYRSLVSSSSSRYPRPESPT